MRMAKAINTNFLVIFLEEKKKKVVDDRASGVINILP